MNELLCDLLVDGEHALIRDEKASTSEKEVWNCICGYFVEEYNDCGSGG